MKIAWPLLLLIHLPPAAVLFSPDLLGRMYGVTAGETVGLLLVNRGALFLGIVAACGFAIMVPEARRVVGLSWPSVSSAS